MCSLKTLHKHQYSDVDPLPPIHVVGENSVDATSALALAPTTEALLPDFVNIHAVYARALVQGIAYPFMQAAIAQLFTRRSNERLFESSPRITLLPVGKALE